MTVVPYLRCNNNVFVYSITFSFKRLIHRRENQTAFITFVALFTLTMKFISP